MPLWKRSDWAGLVPNGLGQVKPNHYLEIVKAIWRNRRELPFAWRILSRGVCDGCALGTKGLRDFTMDGVHLCTVRLDLLRLNTMAALDIERLADADALSSMTSAELRDLGRLPYPMLRKRGDAGFRRIGWDEAIDVVASRIREFEPQRVALYLTSRGISNEVYYVAQKVARFLGTNNVDNAARVCHSPSTMAMKQTLGVGASTCSYKDWIGTDLLVLVGSDVPNNQPVTTKYMYYAKQQGTKIAVINPFREPGLDRYWVPSVLESAVFGTKLADSFFQIHTGGDIPFLNGVLKHLIENGWVDEAFISSHTSGFEEAKAALERQPWELLERTSGASRETMLEFARMYSEARTAVFVWSMGLTQHRFGVQNVKALINLALARGMVGREKCGLMPIRGHSGVQGGAEVGCVPSQLPGGVPFDETSTKRFEELWRFPIPTSPGLSSVEMVEAAHDGNLDILYSLGGNFLETLPEPGFVREALEKIPLRVHQDIVVTNQMLIEPEDTVLLLPAATRYEQRDGATETSTERYIYYSPEIPGRRIGEARSEWEILMDIAERTYPDRRHLVHFDNGGRIREEIANAVPFYDGIQDLPGEQQAVQWGGQRLCEGGDFPMADGRAHFSAVSPPDAEPPDGRFLLSTRRGRQFNSMVHGARDPLTGAKRDAVFMSAEDAERLGLGDGDGVLLRSPVGEFRGRVKIASIRPRNIQVQWPEGLVLIQREVSDPECGIPHYNAVVEAVPVNGAGGQR